MSLGSKIRNAREDMDLRQIDVANRIPMNQSNYSKIERDLQEPSMEQLRRICQILHLDPGYLLGIEGYEPLPTADIVLLKEIKESVRRRYANKNRHA